MIVNVFKQFVEPYLKANLDEKLLRKELEEANQLLLNTERNAPNYDSTISAIRAKIVSFLKTKGGISKDKVA